MIIVCGNASSPSLLFLDFRVLDFFHFFCGICCRFEWMANIWKFLQIVLLSVCTFALVYRGILVARLAVCRGLNNDVILDIDKEGNPVAFEFLNASKLFHLEKSYFNNLIKITVKSTVTDESIKLTAELVFPVHNKTQIFDINRITSNLTGIPETESELATA